MTHTDTREDASGATRADTIRLVIDQIIDDANERRATGRDPVNRAMIHHLCDAFDETNPIYLDPAAARAEGFDDVVAPPAALQVWTMLNPGEQRAGAPDGGDVERAFAALRDGGYPNVVAVNCVQNYDRYLTVGDEVSLSERVESLVGPKQTALGEGWFITLLTTYTDQLGRRVGTMRFRTLWYAAGKGVSQ